MLKLVQHSRFGLVTDMDGTLSEIVTKPEEAVVSADVKSILSELADHLPLVCVLSGRAVEDIVQRVGVPSLTYVGNHGIEEWIDNQSVPHPSTDQFRQALEAAMSEIQSIVVQRPGMQIEDKGETLSIHYRQTKSPDSVRVHNKSIFQEIADQHNLILSEGRMVFEIRPPIEINKGTAFEKLIKEYQLEAALYIGDDITDIPALQKAKEMRVQSKCQAFGIGLKSGHHSVIKTSDLFASDVADVETFLSWLLNARKPSST